MQRESIRKYYELPIIESHLTIKVYDFDFNIILRSRITFTKFPSFWKQFKLQTIDKKSKNIQVYKIIDLIFSSQLKK